MQLFHYHLVTSRVREVEARYIGKLAFDLVARHGRIGEELTSYEPGVAWNELDAMGFKLRLTELEKGAVNVVVQPGQWPTPRVDHLGFVLDEDEFESAIERAEQNDLRVQEHGGRRTFVSTNAGYRLELHPPREWIDELLAQGDELQLSELHLKADDPSGKAKALAAILDADRDGDSVEVGDDRRALRPRRPAGPAGAVRRAVRLAAGHRLGRVSGGGAHVRRGRRLARDGRRGRRAAARGGRVDRRDELRAVRRPPPARTTAASSRPRPTASARS